MALIGFASADSFSEWEVYGDAWKATNDTHTIVKWNQTGEHTWIATGNASTIDYLAVAGGGYGGIYAGSGGGAGGLLTGTIPVNGIINVTVGTGGTSEGANGGNSTLDDLNAIGGGAGARGGGDGAGDPPKIGGSGAGGSSKTGRTIGAAGIAGQGYKGGDSPGQSGVYGSGGGGGAGGLGINAISTTGGNGGPGLQSAITGEALWYAGGGGGGQYSGVASGIGGSGVGGNGATVAGTSTKGMDGRGGGGGGSGGAGDTERDGGSGVIIISYVTPFAPIASFNLVLTDTTTGAPTSWQWNATNLLGNNTPVTISTDQNPIVTLTQGNWLIDLIATNDLGSDTCNSTIGINLTSPQVYFWERTS